jgi:hypothetical protein
VGDRVWVRRVEANSKEWFECEVTEIQRDPVHDTLEYRVKLIDGGVPGVAYEGGKWLPPDRLRDENDRGK